MKPRSEHLFQPPPRKTRIEVAIPASYASTEATAMLKALKWGVLARLLAVYRVDKLYIYLDRPGLAREAENARRIMEYMMTAPYLRKRVYPANTPWLRYAGVLPPLQLPTHGVGGPKPGECREALVVGVSREGVVVEAGLDKPVAVRTRARLSVGERVIVRVASLRPKPRLSLAPRGCTYTGFETAIVKDLRSLLERRRVKIATSRLGEILTPETIAEAVSRARGRGLLVLFGAPDRGLFEIAREERLELNSHVDYVLNTIPGQGTRTVRVEEAVAATLAIINIYAAQQLEQ